MVDAHGLERSMQWTKSVHEVEITLTLRQIAPSGNEGNRKVMDVERVMQTSDPTGLHVGHFSIRKREDGITDASQKMTSVDGDMELLNPIGHHIQSTQANHACQHASQHGYIDPYIGDSGARQPTPTSVTRAYKVQEISRRLADYPH